MDTTEIINNLKYFANKIMYFFISLYQKLNTTIVLSVITLIIVIAGIVYYFYMITLQSRECRKMTDRYGDINGKIKSIDFSNDNFNNPLRDYYIKTAYNCCSGGDYKNDFVDTCILKNVLKQGVRCLDFEIFSINNKPVVATSVSNNYHVKETYNYIDFDDVMNVIQNYAFAGSTAPNPNDPLFIHLRMKSSNIKMYDNFAKILKKYDSILLGPKYSYENHGRNFGNVLLKDLVNKVIIIVDSANNTFMDSLAFYEYVNVKSNSMFMRELRYTEIKSLTDKDELVEFNKIAMTIGLPDKGGNPSNPNSKVMRRTGCQFLAMRYQLNDNNLKENNKFFDQNGYAFVLKPEKLRLFTQGSVTAPENTPGSVTAPEKLRLFRPTSMKVT